ncbi:glycosyltransferase family 4 protein [Paenibacillus daejeonensis]|uniref:glycosyltransferase family 4 protein n=1 Tax=Paenibacillus daejeonensis TaxID=135193 RepID=UPI0003619F5B|nr:glycosyltransferase family 4 protein [Paenibacillus daejeonensis]
MKRKPVVVYVAHDVGGHGGMELHLEEVISRLKNECELIVVSTTLKLKNSTGIRHIKIPVITRPVPLRLVLFSIFATIRIAFIKRDILHTTGAIIFNSADFSTVHFCHNGYINAVGNTRAKNNTSYFKKLNSLLASKIALFMESKIYKPSKTKNLIAVSNRVKEELDSNFAYDAKDVVVIPNGVDTKRFYPQSYNEKMHLRNKYNLPTQGTFLLFMGGDWPLKGLEYVVQSFSGLAQSFLDLYLIVVGKGDSKFYSSALEPSIRNRVIFAGKQTRPEDWMGMSDIFVFPSSYETFSLVVHEAAATGLIILATRVGGVEDLIRDGKDGILIERNLESITTHLNNILVELKSHRYLGENARKNVARLSWENTFEETMQIYKTYLIETKESRGGGFEYIYSQGKK